jgi:tellurite resistance protein
MGRLSASLKFLAPGWFALPMGIAGLALAWHRAVPSMGEMATGVALVLGAIATLVFVALAAATLLRGWLHPQAWAEDRRHPVRHTFIATLPVAAILLATVAVALFGAHPLARAIWWVGSVAQLGVTLWVLARWWRGAAAGGLVWASITPALFIPIVGNVLVPLAGVPLGHEAWASAQFGVGLMFWPVVLVLLVTRLLVQGPWPDRLRPTVFILIAPPAVVALALLQFGAPLGVAWALWGMALFSLWWVALQLRAIVALPFSLPHWAMSFPLAAFTALTLRLATPGGLLAVLGTLLLALTSLVVLMLAAGTLRGLRDGTLLAPEPVAAIVPAAA